MLIGILCALSNILLLPHCAPWGIYVEVPGLFIIARLPAFQTPDGDTDAAQVLFAGYVIAGLVIAGITLL
jgi:hypothetical protein